MEIANMVTSQINAEIIVTESNDPRSYRQDSNKLINTGFKPKFGVNQAIKDIIQSYKNETLRMSDDCYTVRWMKHLSLNK